MAESPDEIIARAKAAADPDAADRAVGIGTSSPAPITPVAQAAEPTPAPAGGGTPLYGQDGYTAVVLGDPPTEVFIANPTGDIVVKYHMWEFLLGSAGGIREALEALDINNLPSELKTQLFDQEAQASAEREAVIAGSPTMTSVTTTTPSTPSTGSPSVTPAPTGSSSGLPGGGSAMTAPVTPTPKPPKAGAVLAALGVKSKADKKKKAKKDADVVDGLIALAEQEKIDLSFIQARIIEETGSGTFGVPDQDAKIKLVKDRKDAGDSRKDIVQALVKKGLPESVASMFYDGVVDGSIKASDETPAAPGVAAAGSVPAGQVIGTGEKYLLVILTGTTYVSVIPKMGDAWSDTPTATIPTAEEYTERLKAISSRDRRSKSQAQLVDLAAERTISMDPLPSGGLFGRIREGANLRG